MRLGHCFIEGIEEWSQFSGGCNWYTFHPLLIELEDDRCMGGVEGTLIILGLGFRVRWNYRETEMTKDIARRIAEIESDLGDRL